MPRLYRASLLGAAALLAGPCIGTALAVWNAHRCGLHPIERAAWCVVRKIAQRLDQTAQPL